MGAHEAQEADLYERLFKCVLCSVDFDAHRNELENAKFLECFHSVCGTCVNLWPNNETKKCPECDFISWKKNLLEPKIIQERMAVKSEKVCGMHSSAENVVWCQDCQQIVCQQCVDNHKALIGTQHHVMKPIDESDTTSCKLFKCTIHPNELLRIYCSTCEKLKCRDCHYASTANIKHKYAFVEGIVNDEKKEIFEIKKTLGYQLDNINESRKIYKNAQDKMKNDYKNAQLQILKDAELLFNEIERLKLNALNNLEKKYRERVSEFNIIQNKYDLRSKILLHSVQFTSALLTDFTDFSLFHCLKNFKSWQKNMQRRKLYPRFIPNCNFELFYTSNVENIKKCFRELGSVHCNKIEIDGAYGENHGFPLPVTPLSPPASIEYANEMSESDGEGVPMEEIMCTDEAVDLSPEIDVVSVDCKELDGETTNEQKDNTFSIPLLDEASAETDILKEQKNIPNSIPSLVEASVEKKKNVPRSKKERILEFSGQHSVEESAEEIENMLINEESVPESCGAPRLVGSSADQECMPTKERISESNCTPRLVQASAAKKEKQLLMKERTPESNGSVETFGGENENNAPLNKDVRVPVVTHVENGNHVPTSKETESNASAEKERSVPMLEETRFPELNVTPRFVEASAVEKEKNTFSISLPELSAQEVEDGLRPRISVKNISALQAPVSGATNVPWFPPAGTYYPRQNENLNDRNFRPTGMVHPVNTQQSPLYRPYDRSFNQGNTQDNQPFYLRSPQFSSQRSRPLGTLSIRSNAPMAYPDQVNIRNYSLSALEKMLMLRSRVNLNPGRTWQTSSSLPCTEASHAPVNGRPQSSQIVTNKSNQNLPLLPQDLSSRSNTMQPKDTQFIAIQPSVQPYEKAVSPSVGESWTVSSASSPQPSLTVNTIEGLMETLISSFKPDVQSSQINVSSTAQAVISEQATVTTMTTSTPLSTGTISTAPSRISRSEVPTSSETNIRKDTAESQLRQALQSSHPSQYVPTTSTSPVSASPSANKVNATPSYIKILPKSRTIRKDTAVSSQLQQTLQCSSENRVPTTSILSSMSAGTLSGNEINAIPLQIKILPSNEANIRKDTAESQLRLALQSSHPLQNVPTTSTSAVSASPSANEVKTTPSYIKILPSSRTIRKDTSVSSQLQQTLQCSSEKRVPTTSILSSAGTLSANEVNAIPLEIKILPSNEANIQKDTAESQLRQALQSSHNVPTTSTSPVSASLSANKVNAIPLQIKILPSNETNIQKDTAESSLHQTLQSLQPSEKEFPKTPISAVSAGQLSNEVNATPFQIEILSSSETNERNDTTGSSPLQSSSSDNRVLKYSEDQNSESLAIVKSKCSPETCDNRDAPWKQNSENLLSPPLPKKRRIDESNADKKEKSFNCSSSPDLKKPKKKRRPTSLNLSSVSDDLFSISPNEKIQKPKEKLSSEPAKKNASKVNSIMVQIPLDRRVFKNFKSPLKKEENKKNNKKPEKELSKTTSPFQIERTATCEICQHTHSQLKCMACCRVYHVRCLQFAFVNEYTRTRSASVSRKLDECIMCERIEKLSVVDSKMDDLSRKVCVRVFLEILIHPKCQKFFSKFDKNGSLYKKEIMQKFVRDEFKQGIIEFVSDLKKLFVNCHDAGGEKTESKAILSICTQKLKQFLPDNCLKIFKINLK